jgi:hypothetical protein
MSWSIALGLPSSAARRLFGLGPRYKVRPVQAAVERVEVVENLEHRFGIVLRRRFAQRPERRRPAVFVPERLSQRDL